MDLHRPPGCSEQPPCTPQIAPIDKNGNAPKFGANAPLTEGLLRNILNLTETHQSKIINGLVSGKIKKGQVKNKAKDYQDREDFALYAIE